MVWDLLEPTLRKSRANYLNGTKGGAPKGNKNNRFSQNTTEQQPKYNRKYNTETDTEIFNNSNQRLESEKPTAFSPTNPIKLENKDFERVKNLWNEHCAVLGRVTKLTSKRAGKHSRKAAITKCVNVLIELSANKSKEEALTTLEGVFRRVQSSSFLCGANERKWKASFDWVLRESNLIKIYEGGYN